jgi:hypothetical protein
MGNGIPPPRHDLAKCLGHPIPLLAEEYRAKWMALDLRPRAGLGHARDNVS